MDNLPFAEDLPYWKTSQSAPDKWMDRAEAVIEKLGGSVTMRAQGKAAGRKAYMVDFEFPPDKFRVLWPVLPTRSDNKTSQNAADRQGATMLYHDVKARSLRATIFGPRTAFFEFLILPDGRTVGQLTNRQLLDFTPPALLPPAHLNR